MPFNEGCRRYGYSPYPFEVIDESGESQPHVFAQKPFSDTFRLSGTGPPVNQEFGVVVIEFEPGPGIPDLTGSRMGSALFPLPGFWTGPISGKGRGL